jgi:hypothetical protein
MVRRGLIASACLAWLLSCESASTTSPESATESAPPGQEAHRRGSAAFAQGDYAAATVHFKDAYREAPHLHAILFNIAASAERAGDCKTASAAYLELAGLVPEQAPAADAALARMQTSECTTANGPVAISRTPTTTAHRGPPPPPPQRSSTEDIFGSALPSKSTSPPLLETVVGRVVTDTGHPWNLSDGDGATDEFGCEPAEVPEEQGDFFQQRITYVGSDTTYGVWSEIGALEGPIDQIGLETGQAVHVDTWKTVTLESPIYEVETTSTCEDQNGESVSLRKGDYVWLNGCGEGNCYCENGGARFDCTGFEGEEEFRIEEGHFDGPAPPGFVDCWTEALRPVPVDRVEVRTPPDRPEQGWWIHVADQGWLRTHGDFRLDARCYEQGKWGPWFDVAAAWRERWSFGASAAEE